MGCGASGSTKVTGLGVQGSNQPATSWDKSAPVENLWSVIEDPKTTNKSEIEWYRHVIRLSAPPPSRDVVVERAQVIGKELCDPELNEDGKRPSGFARSSPEWKLRVLARADAEKLKSFAKECHISSHALQALATEMKASGPPMDVIPELFRMIEANCFQPLSSADRREFVQFKPLLNDSLKDSIYYECHLVFVYPLIALAVTSVQRYIQAVDPRKQSTAVRRLRKTVNLELVFKCLNVCERLTCREASVAVHAAKNLLKFFYGCSCSKLSIRGFVSETPTLLIEKIAVWLHQRVGEIILDDQPFFNLEALIHFMVYLLEEYVVTKLVRRQENAAGIRICNLFQDIIRYFLKDCRLAEYENELSTKRFIAGTLKLSLSLDSSLVLPWLQRLVSRSVWCQLPSRVTTRYRLARLTILSKLLHSVPELLVIFPPAFHDRIDTIMAVDANSDSVDICVKATRAWFAVIAVYMKNTCSTDRATVSAALDKINVFRIVVEKVQGRLQLDLDIASHARRSVSSAATRINQSRNPRIKGTEVNRQVSFIARQKSLVNICLNSLKLLHQGRSVSISSLTSEPAVASRHHTTHRLESLDETESGEVTLDDLVEFGTLADI